MGHWVRVNGGPLAIVVVGLGILGVTNEFIGGALVAIGFLWWVGSALWKRSPWEVKRKPSAPPSRTSGPAPATWMSPDQLGSYLDDINRTMEERGFPNPHVPSQASPTVVASSWEELNDARVRRYEEARGLFLVHEWTPSTAEGQVADVQIRLCQHGEGPLSRGEIKAVEYTLGPKFSNHSLVCTDASNDFATEVSMWGPMLCLAKVYFTGGRVPALLERYINFEADG